MKKIIAISVMFALIAGAAFADLSVGGEFGARVTLIEDKGLGDDARAGEFGFAAGHANVKWEGENAGGMIRLFSTTTRGNDNAGGSIAYYEPDFAFAWWKPIDQLRFQIGRNPDGDWGHAQIVGWGFQAEAQNYVAVDGNAGFVKLFGATPEVPTLAFLARDTGFWGGFGSQGVALSIYPADGIEIDIGIPYGNITNTGTPDFINTTPASVLYANTKLNVAADIPNIGTARVALDLNKANKDADQGVDFYLAFNLTSIENMNIEVGVGVVTSGIGDKKNDQIQLGIGYTLDAGDLGLKARLGVIPVLSGADGAKDYIPLGLNIMPYYNLGSLTAYLNFGVGTMIKVASGDSAGDWMDFYFNPYVKVPANAGNFYAGIKFSQGSKISGGGAKPDASWAIPIGWQVYF